MPWWENNNWNYCFTYHYKITGESSPKTNNKYFIMTNKEYRSLYFPFQYKTKQLIIYSYATANYLL